MKIAIDNKPLNSGHSHRGIGTYTRLLIKSLKEAGGVEVIETHEPYKTKAQIVHYPYFDLFFLTLPFTKPVPTVVTIHDVIPLVMANNYPPGFRGKIKHRLQKASLSSVAKIVTDSDCSTTDVVNFLQQPRGKVATVYLAPDPGLSQASAAEIDGVKNKYGLNKPYFLYVGDINYNKNLNGLLEAAVALPETHELVIVSKAFTRENPAAALLWQTYDRLTLTEKVRVLNTIDTGLAGLYSGALWYVQPSFYEGFGLPVLEAQACGCPVITSTGGSLKEIAAGTGLEFNTDNRDSLKSILKYALSLTTAERDGYIHKGFNNLHRFNWHQTAEAMLRIYQEAL